MSNKFSTAEAARLIRRTVRAELVDGDLRLSEVVRATDLDYSRVVRVLNAYALPREGEVEHMLHVIRQAARNRR